MVFTCSRIQSTIKILRKNKGKSNAPQLTGRKTGDVDLETVAESSPQERVLRRLFQCSLSDWKLIILGTVFLLIVSAGKSSLDNNRHLTMICLAEVFVPLFTGRLLSSVAFKDPYPTFLNNLMLFLGAYFIGYVLMRNRSVSSTFALQHSLRRLSHLGVLHLRGALERSSAHEVVPLVPRPRNRIFRHA